MIGRILKTTLIGVTVMLGCNGCAEQHRSPRVVEVIDMKGEEEHSWKLGYNMGGKLISYGNATITYANKDILISKLDCISSKEKCSSIKFHEVKSSLFECESYTTLEVNGVTYDVRKVSTFQSEKNELYIDANFFSQSDGRLLYSKQSKYLYDTENRLKDVDVCFTEGDKHIEVAHTAYKYNSNIYYDAWPNLKAYIIECDGLDSFFYFLLDLDVFKRTNALPSQIKRDSNKEKGTYMADGLFRLDDESPVRMEIITNNMGLKTRVDFEY